MCATTVPKIPRGVSVPQTVPLRNVAMDVKWLPRWEEDVRIMSVNIVDEANNLQHIYPFFESEISEVFNDSTVSGHEPKEGLTGSKSTRVEPTWVKRGNERSRQMVPNSWMSLEKRVSKSVELKCVAVISRTSWREFWLRFGQTLGQSGSNAFTRCERIVLGHSA